MKPTERGFQDNMTKKTLITGSETQAPSRRAAKEEWLKTLQWNRASNQYPKWFPNKIRIKKTVTKYDGANIQGTVTRTGANNTEPGITDAPVTQLVRCRHG